VAAESWRRTSPADLRRRPGQDLAGTEIGRGASLPQGDDKPSKTVRLLSACAFVLGFASLQSTAAQEPNLYDRLGGRRGITLVVDDFIDRLVANETLNKNPAISAGRKSSPAPYLRVRRMPHASTPEARRLLRVLFVWNGALSTAQKGTDRLLLRRNQ
jgi:hypothetical protein